MESRELCDRIIYITRIQTHSYGSVLGATFAALFPVSLEIWNVYASNNWQDNVNRLIIDGVLDANDYYSSEIFRPFLTTSSLTGDYKTYGSRIF